MSTNRRRPVPVEWREEHHWLDVGSRRSYGVRKGSVHYTRAWGRCSCGKEFGTLAGNHTLHAADVRDKWKDHVEDAYYAETTR